MQFDVIARIHFSKTAKLPEHVRQVQFVVFENLSSAHYTKIIVREMMLLLVNSVHEKTSQKVITDEISKA